MVSIFLVCLEECPVRRGLEATTAMNRSHSRSPGGTASWPVAPETLERTQEPRAQNMPLFFHLCPGRPQARYSASQCGYSPPRAPLTGEGCHDGSSTNLVGSKLPLPTHGRSPPDDWKQPPLQTTLSRPQDPVHTEGKDPVGAGQPPPLGLPALPP